MKSVAGFCIFLSLLLTVAAEVDPFYLKTFAEGKDLVLQQKYTEAVESFRLAEFGLLSEKEILKELYLYYAVAQYLSGKPEEARRMLDKCAKELGIPDVLALPRPKAIEKELQSLFTGLKMGLPKAPPAANPKPSRRERRQAEKSNSAPATAPGFDEEFSRAQSLLLNNQLKEGEEVFSRLRKSEKKNPRLFYLQGLLAFQKRDYNRSAEQLKEFLLAIPDGDPLIAESYYYLALSHYLLKQHGLTLAYYRLSGGEVQNRLKEVVAKVMDARSRSITPLAEGFSSRALEEICRQFAGDRELCSDFLRLLLSKYRYRAEYIQQILPSCLDHPSCYDREFILLAVSFLRSVSKPESAVEMIRKSQFAKFQKPEDVPMQLLLGELYFDLKKYEKALGVFESIKAAYSQSPEAEQWLQKVRLAMGKVP